MNKVKNTDFRICTDDDIVVDKINNSVQPTGVSAYEVRAIQRLWKAVILTAFQDASRTSNKISAILVRRKAVNWLLYNNRDFYQVCDFAGLDPVMVRQYAREICGEKSSVCP